MYVYIYTYHVHSYTICIYIYIHMYVYVYKLCIFWTISLSCINWQKLFHHTELVSKKEKLVVPKPATNMLFKKNVCVYVCSAA